MIEIEMTGMNDILGKLKKFSMKDAVENTMSDAAELCEMYAQGYCPVDTGTLIESIYSVKLPDGFIIGADAPHAVFNEYGSITTPAGDPHAPLPAKKVGVRPFLRPAIYRVREEMQKIFNKNTEEIISHG